MKKFPQLLALGGLVMLLAGCNSVVGTWTLDSVEPAEARQHYDLASVVFKDDGTYVAMAEENGDDMSSTGLYTYEGNVLTFMPEGGDERVYNAQVMGFGSKLKVTKKMHGQEVTAVMKKE